MNTNVFLPKLIALLAATALFSTLCRAQENPPADEGRPASTNVPGQQFPRIHADLSATFRFNAPDAPKVEVDIVGRTYPMTKDDKGAWTATTARVARWPGFRWAECRRSSST